MKNSSLTLIILIISCANIFATSVPIPQANYTIQAFSSQTGNVATNAIDNDTTTFWAIGGNPTLPAFIEIDLGSNHDINGFSFLPKKTSNNNKPSNYELYLSNNGTTWGTPEKSGTMTWSSSNDLDKKEFFFGKGVRLTAVTPH